MNAVLLGIAIAGMLIVIYVAFATAIGILLRRNNKYYPPYDDSTLL